MNIGKSATLLAIGVTIGIAGSAAAASLNVSGSTTLDALCKAAGYVLATVAPTSTPTPAPTPTPVTVPSTGQEKRFQAYTTGYGWPDNTPKGSADISNGLLHSRAGGTGTFSDPITLAVGHSISAGKDTLDYPAGTRFYIPNLHKYFIVEDTCGDGNTPQNGPCHTGYQGHVWLDLWVGGNSSNEAATLACEDSITDVHTVIQNPGAGYPVVTGDVAAGCQQFGQ